MDDRLSKFELRTLIDSTKLILESQEMSFILNNLLFMVMGKLMLTRALILLWQPEKGNYRVARTKGKSHFVQDQEFRLPIDIPAPNAPAIRLLDKEAENFPQMLANEGYRVMVTLRTNNEHIGWLCLGGKPTGTLFAQRELDFLESVVIIPSVGIANARLIEELKVANQKLDFKVQELHTLFDLSKEFSQSVDRNQILRIFKFALMGQMGVRTFFLSILRNGEHELVTHNGLAHQPDSEMLASVFSAGDAPVIACDQFKEPAFLHENQIQVLINLSLQDTKSAVIGIGKRIGRADFAEADTNFLISLGNLMLMSVQKTYLIEARVEKERLEKELALASTIQQNLLPAKLPEIFGVDLAARNIPSRQVGGDYYDMIALENGNYLIAIADVTGKGVPASLIMANVQAMVHMLAPLPMPLTEKTTRINEVIYQNTPSDTFVTFFWGEYNPQERSFTYVNAGHNPPMLFRKSGDIQELKQGGIILGALPAIAPYLCETIQMDPGDRFILFTDGITEAMSPADEEFDESRLIETISGSTATKAEALSDEIIAAITRHTKGNYSDDVTLIVMNLTESAPET